MKIIVTGVAGFLGSHLAQKLSNNQSDQSDDGMVKQSDLDRLSNKFSKPVFFVPPATTRKFSAVFSSSVIYFHSLLVMTRRSAKSLRNGSCLISAMKKNAFSASARFFLATKTASEKSTNTISLARCFSSLAQRPLPQPRSQTRLSARLSRLTTSK